jgi:hypothetical protein
MHQHVPRCDCAECLPGFPAAPTQVRHDPTPLHNAPPTAFELARLERRREQTRKANRKWRAENAELAREATREWRRNNPEKVRLGKLLAEREEREASEAERFAESTAAE